MIDVQAPQGDENVLLVFGERSHQVHPHKGTITGHSSYQTAHPAIVAYPREGTIAESHGAYCNTEEHHPHEGAKTPLQNQLQRKSGYHPRKGAKTSQQRCHTLASRYNPRKGTIAETARATYFPIWCAPRKGTETLQYRRCPAHILHNPRKGGRKRQRIAFDSRAKKYHPRKGASQKQNRKDEVILCTPFLCVSLRWP